MLQEMEFFGREVQTLAVYARLVLQPVQLDATIAQQLRASCAAPPHERAYPGEELIELERLGEIVVGAGIQPTHHVLGGVARRQHQNGRRASLTPQLPSHLQPGLLGSMTSSTSRS